ncbi:conjugative transfer signal peptidase TraF [Rhizobium leguminosarum]|uniref:conjugative transfer signal peptidase TraF n=1 Tax=Rhizobium leguminosarum TaxID=384 RepID=UPI001C902B5C|nr:conjugative transfer signal peptidase TraF [Rhizobium leguminosarum]MBY2973115.1 conjugative transfer signal peptidase TraF [Rhizobium leguminosarum]MBY2980515.1 conjugative transfer signal peptidase TraF [Rhizobium leguminosarum]MBY3009066.1 conjugative transfer signal peptidase TraF [Rhizobium leguminosarum]
MRRRQVLLFLAGAGVVIVGLVAAGSRGGYRLNLTPSEPLGLWRIEGLYRDVAVGDLVFVCPPVNDTFDAARRRGYLRWGSCTGGFAPLIKTVAALARQRVEIGDQVVIDGRPIKESSVRTKDGKGRVLVPYAGGIVPPGYLFLHSSFEGSYDSRYFGPVPDAGILGLARPVFTLDP